MRLAESMILSNEMTPQYIDNHFIDKKSRANLMTLLFLLVC
jgi:hypothetical protein